MNVTEYCTTMIKNPRAQVTAQRNKCRRQPQSHCPSKDSQTPPTARALHTPKMLEWIHVHKIRIRLISITTNANNLGKVSFAVPGRYGRRRARAFAEPQPLGPVPQPFTNPKTRHAFRGHDFDDRSRSADVKVFVRRRSWARRTCVHLQGSFLSASGSEMNFVLLPAIVAI